VSSPSGNGRGQDGATVERFEVTLEGLRQLRRRLLDQQLEAGDWPLLGALVSKQIARAEQRQERMIAKLAAAAGQEANGEALGADGSVDGESTSSGERESAAGGGEGEADKVESKKPKGHGRNGAGVYSKAKHFFYALAVGVIGGNRSVGWPIFASCRLTDGFLDLVDHLPRGIDKQEKACFLEKSARRGGTDQRSATEAARCGGAGRSPAAGAEQARRVPRRAPGPLCSPPRRERAPA
jgi:hypothetical protein